MPFRSRDTVSLVCLCLLAQPLFGLDPNRALTQALHRIWQTPEGLPPAAIRGILQTSDGFLWLSTDQGLLRFDGIRFSSLAEIAGFSGDQAGTGQLLENSRHDLWAINDGGGLLQVRGGSKHVEQFAGNFHCLIAGQGNEMWGCSAQGLAHRISSGAWQVYNSENIDNACVRKDGTVWTGGHGNVLKMWDGREFRSYTLHEAGPNTLVQALLGSKDNALWIGTADGLIELRDGQERVRMKTSVLSLSEGSDGSVW